MGRVKPFILLGIAVLVALITSVLIYSWLQKKGSAVEKVAKTRPVVVAQTDLSWGNVIENKEMVGVKPYLEESLPPGTFTDPSSVIKRVVIYPVEKGEPILESSLAPKDLPGGGVAAIISPQKRAMAIRVDKIVGVSGFIHPNNRVDVLVTVNHKVGEKEDVITKIVLENMLVLATGSEVQEKGTREKPIPVDVITLEVTPQEAEKLALAATQGRIILALRNYTDTQEVKTKGATIPTLLASDSTGGIESPRRVKSTSPGKGKGGPGKPHITPQKAPKKYIVQVIEGSKISETVFEKGE